MAIWTDDDFLYAAEDIESDHFEFFVRKSQIHGAIQYPWSLGEGENETRGFGVRFVVQTIGYQLLYTTLDELFEAVNGRPPEPQPATP